mgnify:FL=1
MTADHSLLVYASTFRPLDHWQRVLPGARLVEADAGLTELPATGLLWVSSDVSEWQSLVREGAAMGARVAVLSRLPEPVEMNRALASGARAYLPALSNERVFQQVADTVRAGGLWFPEDLLASLLRTVASTLNETPPPVQVDLSALTSREREVALRAAQGATNRHIAAALGITERTVKEHMGSVFKKLGVRDRMQLMLLVRGQTPGKDDVRQAQ